MRFLHSIEEEEEKKNTMSTISNLCIIFAKLPGFMQHTSILEHTDFKHQS